MKRLLLISLLLLLILFIFLFCLHQYLLSQIYPAPKFVNKNEINKSIVISVQIGKRIAHGIFINGNDQLVVLFHGNGSSLHEMIPVLNHLADPGFSVFLIEYPGYGLSNKSKSNEYNILQDSQQLIDYIAHNYGFSNNRITLLGYSLGGSVAIALASQGIGSKIITIDTFTSMDDVISQTLPRNITGLINTEKFDNITNAKFVNQPVLILHGERDNYIPYEMAERLKSAIHNSRLITINSNNHATVLSDIPNDIWNQVIDFIKRGKI